MALVEYKSPSQQTDKAADLANIDMTNISAEDVGQLIHHLQEEIKIIK